MKLNVILFLLLNEAVQFYLWKNYSDETKKKIAGLIPEITIGEHVESSLKNRFPYVSEDLTQGILSYVSQVGESFKNQISSSSFSFPSSDLMESKIIPAIKNKDLNFLNSALHVGSSTVSILSGGEKPSERK